MRILAVVVVLLGLGSACGGSSPPPAESPPAAAAADPTDPAPLGPMCDRYYVRQRACVAEYLARLLEVRLEYDQPPGIRAEHERDGRDAVLALMRTDWERDTTLEVTDAICRGMAEHTPPADVARHLRDGEACEATTDCTSFAHCAVETERTYIQSGARH